MDFRPCREEPVVMEPYGLEPIPSDSDTPKKEPVSEMIERMSKTQSVLDRMLCVVLYAGIAPVAYLLRYHRKSDFTNHHVRHALSSAFAAYAVLLVLVILRIPLIELGIHRDDLYYTFRIDAIQSMLFKITFGALLLLTAFSACCALAGRSGRVPILSRVSKRAWLPAVMLVLFTISLAAVLTTTGLAYYSLSITPQSNNEAKVFMLYDDGGVAPRWAFTLGFLSVTERASDLLGPDSVCVCKLTHASFKHAFSQGKFIVLATHGAGPGRIYAGRQIYSAADALEASDGNQPRFIYLTGCNVSDGDDSWAQAFPQTDLVSFSRWSATAEHILWLYSEAPDKLGSLFP